MHTVPFYRDDTPGPDGAGGIPTPDHEPGAAVRTLAVSALLQEARRRRATVLPVQTLRAALLADLRTIGAPPPAP